MTMPLTPADAPAASAVAGSIPDGATVVLMVDDEPSVRMLYARMLRREGYHALEARDGVEALRVAADAGRLDLVITDVLMPAMRGPELAARLRMAQPDLRFLFVSGYVIEEDLGPNAHILEKPFARQQFMKAVADIVGPPGVATTV